MTNTRDCFITFPNTKKEVENMAHSGVFLINLKCVESDVGMYIQHNLYRKDQVKFKSGLLCVYT